MAQWVNAREHPGRPKRVLVNLPVVLEIGLDSKAKAVIEDLSQDGFRLRSEVPLHAGQALKMHLPREIVECELRWVDGFTAGGIFHRRANPAQW